MDGCLFSLFTFAWEMLCDIFTPAFRRFGWVGVVFNILVALLVLAFVAVFTVLSWRWW